MDKKKKAGDPSAKECANCGIRDGVSNVKLRECGRCSVTPYCGKSCQSQHWPDHKAVCVAPKDRTPKVVAAAAAVEATDKVTDKGGTNRMENECPICLELLGSEKSNRTTLPCKHVLHKECVEGLRKLSVLQACPLCRTGLPPKPSPEQLYDEATRRYFAVSQRMQGPVWEPLTQPQQTDMTEVIAMWTTAADEGHVPAQCMLALAYRHGYGVPVTRKEAVRFARMAAEQGEAVAQLYLGEYYRDGYGVPKNASTSFLWYQKAAYQDFGPGQFNFGKMYEEGRAEAGVEQNYEEAAHWYVKATSAGPHLALPDANFHLGKLYANGLGVLQNDAKAAHYITKAAEGGEREAIFFLALNHYHGTGLAKNVSKAARWVRTAIEQGCQCPALIHCIADAYLNGCGVKKSLPTAADLFLVAAEQGELESQKALGIMYRDGGPGFPKNPVNAAQWFEAAAEQGDAELQGSLASMFDHGQGVPQSDHKAMKWYSRAAVRGDARAQFSIGTFHYHGRGGLKTNRKEAAKWYQKAADQGMVNAQGALGDMYSRGDGVTKSLSKSKKFFEDAAKHGGTKSEAKEEQPVSSSSEDGDKKACSSCGLQQCQRGGKKPLLCCSRCKAAWYCNSECQKKHWKAHRSSCVVVATK